MSGFSTTPNFALKKPITGADDDMWGTHWNQNADALDTLIQTVQNAVPLPSSTTPVMDGTAAIGVGTTWARSDHIHPTDTSRYAASNPSGYQTAAQVATAVTTAAQYPNFADNSGFSVNQRGYVSGTALAAAAYAHDRWKAGAGGCTYTFAASPPVTTITITAGSLQQVVEGASVAGGNYMLSWTGTAQGRVGAGSYAASPVAVTGATAGANLTIEFNAGTLGRVKLEPGTTATPWTAGVAQQELARCQRFYQIAHVLSWVNNQVATGQVGASTAFATAMRATPTLVLVNNASTNVTGLAASGNPTSCAATGNTTANGTTVILTDFLASADL